MDSLSKKPSLSYILLRSFFALLAGYLIFYVNLDFVESYLYDFRVRAKSAMGFSKVKDPHIALIIINAKTVEKFQREPHFEDHIRFLNQLSGLKPKSIVYEFRTDGDDFTDIKGSYQQKIDFALQIKSFPNLVFSTQDLALKGQNYTYNLKMPLDKVPFYSMPFSMDSKSFGKDSVSRRLMYHYQGQYMYQLTLAGYFNPDVLNKEKIQGSFEYLESDQIYVNYSAPGSFPVYKFEDVFEGKIKASELENKIVIVGSDLAKSPSDYAATPFNRHFTAITKAELQAHQIQTLIDNDAPIRVPQWLDLALTLLVSLITVYITLALKPGRGLLILGAVFFIAALLAFGLFIGFDLWIDLAHPFLAIFLCYYFFIPYRLIKENRRSWEYYQKNKLLTEVEELKTNFISMMSHDLKTPIARILGMTELIYKDPQPLSSSQQEALDTIRNSSDDLLKFINSILQYGRIESQGIELHKQAKDINALLQEVIKKHEFLAKVKRIKITTDLEPMFPTQVDPELMKQVFSNLLENAIKYSHEDSTVHVQSRELNDFIIVDFKDQGLGIPAVDLPNIFMKFFRTHTVKTSTIKGSGLGLYLAQYFVNLHKGQIKVVSEQGQGSTFTVELPSQN